jgi:plasmid stabilization system protein ParE
MIRFAPKAIADMQRLRGFLYPNDPRAAQRAMEAISRKIRLLEEFSQLGLPTSSRDVRQTHVRFGKRGYVVRYAARGEILIVLRVWHGREAR